MPIWPTAPAPEIAPLKFTVSERLKASMPLLDTPPEMPPEMPPLPSCNVPPEIVVPPL